MKKKLLSLCLVGALAFGTACSASWLSTFQQYLAIAGPVLIQVLDIVAVSKGVAPDAALVAKINKDQASLNALAKDVAKIANDPNPQSTCLLFNTAVATFAGDFNQIVQLANIGQNTSVRVQAVIGIAQAAIQEVEAPISACASAPTPMAARAVFAGKATIKSPSDVVKQFNAVVEDKNKVHIHGKFLRFVSAGKLQ